MLMLTEEIQNEGMRMDVLLAATGGGGLGPGLGVLGRWGLHLVPRARVVNMMLQCGT
jgi:hypothetical protein